MSRRPPAWVVGDVQGCYFSLMRLLTRLRWRPGSGPLWLLGDVVNRGAHSARTLDWLVRHHPAADTVLGNHDLGLLALAEGLRRPAPRDTAQAVLAAPGAPGWLAHLARRPWAATCHGHLLVHAGLDARWHPRDVIRVGRALGAIMAGPRRRALLHALGTPPPQGPSAARTGDGGGMAVRAEQARTLTWLRRATRHGQPDYHVRVPPLPGPGWLPWPLVPHRRSAQVPVVFGHWSQLGLWRGGNATCLDTGCVWGRQLTAMRLPDGAIEQVAVDPRDRPAVAGGEG